VVIGVSEGQSPCTPFSSHGSLACFTLPQDFPDSEARQFFDKVALPSYGCMQPVEDAEWVKIKEVRRCHSSGSCLVSIYDNQHAGP
jgi:hypothetical protein